MIKNLLKGILSAIAIKLLDHYRHLSIQLLKIEAARSYLHAVRLARLSARGMVGMGLVINLIFLGVLLFHAGLFILLPWSLEDKAVFGMILGLAYMMIGVITIRVAMNEAKWIQKSGAAEMLDDAIGKPK